MANLGDIVVGIGANTGALKRGLRSAEKDIVRFTSKSKTSLKGMGKGFLAMAGAATAAAAAFTAFRVVRGAVDEFIKFEDALLDLKKVLNDSEGDVEQYIGTVDELSDRFATSATEVLQGAANFKQAGFTVQEAFKLQETALTSARISELSVVESSELLISTLKGFDAPVEDATKILDGLNEVSNKYATSLGQLGRGMAEIAPIAKEMGFTYAETAGFLTPVIEVFRSGTEAGNALKISFLNLTSSQSRVLEGLHKLEVDQEDANGEMKTGRQIVMEVARAWHTLSDSQKPVVAALLAGKRQAARFSVAIRDMAKNMEIAETFNNALGSSQKELDTRMQSTGAKIDRMRIAWRKLQREVGGAVAPAIVELSKTLKDLFRSMEDSKAIDTLGSSLNDLILGFKLLIKVAIQLKNVIMLPFDAVDLVVDKTISKVKELARITSNIFKSITGIGDKVASQTQTIRLFVGPPEFVGPPAPFIGPPEPFVGPPEPQKSITAAAPGTNIKDIKKEAERDMKSIKKTAKETFNSLQTQTTAFTSTLQNTVDSAMQDLGNSMGDLMFDAWNNDMDSFSEKFRGFIKGIEKMIFNALGQAVTQKFITPFINSALGLSGGTNTPALPGVLGGGPTRPGSGGGSFLSGAIGIGKALLGFHQGGIVTMHNGGIKADERLAKLQIGEGVLSRKDMRNIGGATGFNNLRSGGGMTINVPVSIQGGTNDRIAFELQRNIEAVVIKTIKEFV